MSMGQKLGSLVQIGFDEYIESSKKWGTVNFESNAPIIKEGSDYVGCLHGQRFPLFSFGFVQMNIVSLFLLHMK